MFFENNINIPFIIFKVAFSCSPHFHIVLVLCKIKGVIMKKEI